LACLRKEKDEVADCLLWFLRSHVFPYCLAAAMQAAATHLELGVATSANEIANALAFYFCAASLYYSYWFVRESWLWHVLSRLDSFSFGDALKNAKQLFSTRLSKMTICCIMCENILHGYLYDGDLVFVILKGISIFKFPKRFLEISSRGLTSFLIQLI
jgi:hypothetical protein